MADTEEMSIASEGGRALREATMQGDHAVVAALLTQGVPVDTPDVNGWTALMLAEKHDRVELVPLLVENEASVNAANKHNHTSLFYAARRGSAPIQHYLLDHRADPLMGTDNGIVLLTYAAEFGYVNLVQRYINQGVPINGYPVPLIAAMDAGDISIARLLLDYGADPNQISVDKFLRAPLASAVWNSRPDLVTLLLQYGVDVNARRFRWGLPLNWALDTYERARKRQDPETIERAEAVITLLRDAGAMELNKDDPCL